MLEDATNEEVLAEDSTQEDTADQAVEETTDETDVSQEAKDEKSAKEKSGEWSQQLYQDSLARLDAADSTGRMKAIAKGEALPAQEETTTGKEDPRYVGDMTEEQFAKLIAYHTDKASRAIAQEQVDANEFAQADAVVSDFIQQNNITQEEYQSIQQQLNSMGVRLRSRDNPNGQRPIEVGKAFMMVAQGQAMDRYNRDSTRAAVDDAANKALALKGVQQPAGASPTTPAEKTKEEKLLDQMNAAGSNETIDEVFD